MPLSRRFWPACVALAALLLPCGARAFAETEPHPSPAVAVDQGAQRLLWDCLQGLAVKSTDADRLFFEDGVWHSADDARYGVAPRLGPGSAAAALLRLGDPKLLDAAARERLRDWAIRTFDRLIREHRNPDGSFGNSKTPEPMFAGVELASAYLDLQEQLDAATRRRWRDALAGLMDYLVASGNLGNPEAKGGRADGWYTNGNIELDELLLIHLAGRVTGDPKYRAMFERQYSFVLSPPQPRWKGFGLVITKEPTKADGSDGAGYLGEGQDKGPGFDADYSMFQASIASRLYLATGDARFLRLVNLLVNQLLPLVDQTTWIIDARGGSRRSHQMPFFTSGMALAAFQGGRPELAALVPKQFERVAREYRAGVQQGWLNPGLFRGLAADIAVFAESAHRARVSAGASPQNP